MFLAKYSPLPEYPQSPPPHLHQRSGLWLASCSSSLEAQLTPDCSSSPWSWVLPLSDSHFWRHRLSFVFLMHLVSKVLWSVYYCHWQIAIPRWDGCKACQVQKPGPRECWSCCYTWPQQPRCCSQWPGWSGTAGVTRPRPLHAPKPGLRLTHGHTGTGGGGSSCGRGLPAPGNRGLPWQATAGVWLLLIWLWLLWSESVKVGI